MHEVMLTQSDNGAVVDVTPGQLVRLRLPENPSTGFRWALEPEDDDAVLALLETDYEPPHDTAAGAGGWRVWVFRARASGCSGLAMKRWRAWEGDRSVAERFDVTVRVGR